MSPVDGEEIVRAEGVRYLYPDGTEVNYCGHPFVVSRGERAVLLGPNGSGKSTLLFHLLGLLRPTAGLVRVFGLDPSRDFERLRSRIGALLQNPDEQILAPTVREDIAFSPRNYAVPEEEVAQRVAEVARDLEIEHLLDKVPHYLSGGEKKKVGLAGALAMRPELLVLDEPFEGLDTVAKAELADLLNRLHETQRISLIVTTHEINLVPGFVDRVYLLARGGAIVLAASPRELFGYPDLLAQHHLEPPVLAALFQKLRERGIDLDPAITIDEAADELCRWLAPQPA